jgi:hypothetical protein
VSHASAETGHGSEAAMATLRRIATAKAGDIVSIDRDKAILCITSASTLRHYNVFDIDKSGVQPASLNLTRIVTIPALSPHHLDLCVVELGPADPTVLDAQGIETVNSGAIFSMPLTDQGCEAFGVPRNRAGLMQVIMARKSRSHTQLLVGLGPGSNPDN